MPKTSSRTNQVTAVPARETIVRSFTGTVTSVPDVQTATVLVNRTVVHPKYGKRYQRSKKYRCHLLDVKPTVGQTVMIAASRPYSKTKRWVVRSIVS